MKKFRKDDFIYKDVFLKGKPVHTESFYISHPAMNRTKRAKIFSSYDALKGFKEMLAGQEDSPGCTGPAEYNINEVISVCTRYYIEKDHPALKEIIESASRSNLAGRFLYAGDPLLTSGEIGPAQVAPVLAPSKNGAPSVFPMKWGFNIPGVSLILNARSESAKEKPSFKKAWKDCRCIIPASYYFEWSHPENKKPGAKYAIQPEGSAVTWLCGLYRIEEGLPHFVILTREPSEELKKIHERMPMILPDRYIYDWINPLTDADKMKELALTQMAAEPV